MIELACPESCSYLIEARRSVSQREMEIRRKETAADPRNLAMNERAYVAVDAVQRAVVNARRGIGASALHDLDDAETLAAIEVTKKNIETEESGLVYEHPAASPRIGELSRRIREALAQINLDMPAEARPRRSEILKALAFIRDTANAHILRAAGDAEPSRTFLRFISLFYPWPEEATRPILI